MKLKADQPVKKTTLMFVATLHWRSFAHLGHPDDSANHNEDKEAKHHHKVLREDQLEDDRMIIKRDYHGEHPLDLLIGSTASETGDQDGSTGDNEEENHRALIDRDIHLLMLVMMVMKYMAVVLFRQVFVKIYTFVEECIEFE